MALIHPDTEQTEWEKALAEGWHKYGMEEKNVKDIAEQHNLDMDKIREYKGLML